jgi:hypothetical protein
MIPSLRRFLVSVRLGYNRGMKPKFSLRDLFWLVLVCGVAVGWWLEHRHFSRLKNDTLWKIVGEYGDRQTGEAVLDLAINYHPDPRIRSQLAADREDLLDQVGRGHIPGHGR